MQCWTYWSKFRTAALPCAVVTVTAAVVASEPTSAVAGAPFARASFERKRSRPLPKAASPRTAISNSPWHSARLALGQPAAIFRRLLAATPGEVAEWFKAHAWNACIRETVSGVRIPLSPPSCLPISLFSHEFRNRDRHVPHPVPHRSQAIASRWWTTRLPPCLAVTFTPSHAACLAANGPPSSRSPRPSA